MVGFIVPLMLLVAGYLLWAGAKQPGGAFQAGAVLAAAGVLLRLAGKLPPPDPEAPGVRIGLAAGLAVFLGVFVPGVLATFVLALEAVLAVSIGLALLCLFAAARR
jgi:multisubunit Na+/H+ antiporter MnhB subunit